MKRSSLAKSAIQGRSLATYVTLAVVVMGMGFYLWLAWRGGPMFFFVAIGIALAVGLAAEEIIRLQDGPPRRNPSVETKGKVDA
ncbi:MAG TPA: hypothetical protein VFE60_21495 [Roseiarcus sp.]|jgi:O-antigen ligase|nr:hypothetical protein [Roseiarcus sp.]